MNPLPWALATVAVAAAIVRLVFVQGKVIDHDALFAMLVRLLRNEDLARAKKLTAVLTNSPVGAAMRAVVLRLEELSPRMDPLVARSALESTFAEEYARGVASLQASRFLSVVSLSATLAAVVVSFQFGPPVNAVLLGAGIAIVVTLYSMRSAHRATFGGPKMFEKILPILLERLDLQASPYRSQIIGASSDLGSPRRRKGVIFVDVVRPGAETRHLELEEPVMKIGTQTTAHVRLDAAGGASRMHAVMERTAEGLSIIDLGNDIGTWVHGAKVGRAALRHGDEVTIGATTLRIGIEAPPTEALLSTPLDTTDDPATWQRAPALHLYGFDSRSPDLFYEIIDHLLRPTATAHGVRLAKLRRTAGAPTFVVALLSTQSAVAAARTTIEQQIESHYARFTTKAADIAPDATYGRETATAVRLRDELATPALQVLATTVL